MSAAMARPASVLLTADLKQIGSQQGETLPDFVVKLSGERRIFTIAWYGFSDATGIFTNMR